MPDCTIPFQETNYFSDLICDYLNESSGLKEFYGLFPSISNFEKQIKTKSDQYQHEFREVLADRLLSQYEGFTISESTDNNISSLRKNNTYTIVTGHQLNLNTGPLYFFYKIISTINLCKRLGQEYSEYKFVPIYWMATEDHDFDEINFFNYKGKKIQWNHDASGVVGELNLDGLKEVFEVFSKELNASSHAESLKELFRNAYLNHSNLADATRYLVNALFQDEGLVIIDGNDKALKGLFQPYMKQEIFENLSYTHVEETNSKLENLESNYTIQVHPREINLFYIKDSIRERLIELDGRYYVNDTEISWNRDKLLEELNDFPERFSPNVIMRPVYQEVILPNLCYIGGGGELAYWLQLKSSFESYSVIFPMLLLRNSALLINDDQLKKLNKLNVDVKDLFLRTSELETLITKQVSEIDIDFSKQKDHLKKQFKDLYELAKETDASFIGAVSAQEKKQMNGLTHLEKRLLKAQKRKLKDYIERVTAIQSQLFPNQSLQERQDNFSEYYLEKGPELIDILLRQLDPFKQEFLVINI